MNKIQSQVQQIISDKIAPCVLFWVEQDGQLLYQETQGTTMYEDTSSQPIAQDAIFDIASITKIVVATAVLMLIDKGILSLTDTHKKFIPSSTYGQNVTVQHLLTHTSGISVQMSRLAKLESREQMWEAVLRAPLAQAPGVKVVSTNVNTFLLGRIIETVAQERLDHFLKRELFVPLDMQDTCFNPPETTWDRIPPTEIMDGRGLVRGQVHDESAFALGGIVGHAGLFSTAGDLRKFCRLWLEEGVFQGRRLLSQSLAQKAVQNHAPPHSMAIGLGWSLNRKWMGQFGSVGFGHTAFTGPSIMIAKPYGLSAIFLANRTYPHRRHVERHTYQGKIMDALFAEIVSGK